MNVQEIMALLPHRYPFLLLDRVVECVPGEHIVALKNVTANEPQFQGHFPQQMVFPGVLIVEAMAQAAGVLALTAHREKAGGVFYLTGVDGFRFRRPVVPGDQLVIRVQRTAMKRLVWKFAATATVDGKVVAEGEVTAAMAD